MTRKRAVKILMGCAGMSRNEAKDALHSAKVMYAVFEMPDMRNKDVCVWLLALAAFYKGKSLRIQDVKGIDPGHVRWLLCDIRWNWKEKRKNDV